MTNRHLARSIVLQTLFEWDFKKKPDTEIGDILGRNVTEFGPGLEDTTFLEKVLEDIVRKKEVIDEIITKAAPEWPLDKINAVDRNILRIGLAELLFGDFSQVPPKVAINEAIELAKTFGGESSSKFINGVLGAVYRDMGEPGKDQGPKKRSFEPIDPSKLPVEEKAGAVVYAKEGGELYLALVHDVFGYWTLSKGGVEKGESAEIAAVREIKEEIDADIKIKEQLAIDEYIASHPAQGKIKKRVTFFLAEAPYKELHLESSGGLDDCGWFKLTDIPNLEMYDSIAKIITKAVEIITK
jgi:N utilization substance protein B